MSKDLPLSVNPAANAAADSDRQWFRDHPASTQYLRPLVPGEFDVIALGRDNDPSCIHINELPPSEEGMRWMVLVSVMTRDRAARVREPVRVPAELSDEPIPIPPSLHLVTPNMEQFARALKDGERAEWLDTSHEGGAP